MKNNTNPFHELYVTETVGPDSFVEIFSPFLVKHALALFKPGNIILKGIKGSGKSMLLKLLSPDTRLAYGRAKVDFPVPLEVRNFVGAGINITRCGVLDFGQRPMTSDGPEAEVLPLYFGDFVNYWIVLDLLNTIETLIKECDGSLSKDLGIQSEKKLLDKFASVLATDDCWFGYLSSVADIESFKKQLSARINTYRSFLNFNINKLPIEITESKTSIGIPISKTVKALKECEVLLNSTNVFIKIDQYEELTRLKGLSNVGTLFRQVINKAIGQRDPFISYRIGTRRYAWNDNLHIYGTTSTLEEERDYKVVDIDNTLQRKENRRTWIFPAFAEEVFKRRMKQARFPVDEQRGNLVKKYFGNGLSPEQLSKIYAGASPQRAVVIDESWPKSWSNFVFTLVQTDPLSARLAEAWARQQGKENIVNEIPKRKPYPWEKQKYWKKERINQALMQIAARCGQRMIWTGAEDIYKLSGGNILFFLSICQHIWGVWLRDLRGQRDDEIFKLPVGHDVQAVGIHEASSHWFEEITKEPEGDTRQRFIRYIGTKFYSTMYEDKAMSYPGYNGFSLKIEELEETDQVRTFLNDAVDFGALYDAPHTTKTRDRAKRIKWYLNPILSPYFRIPAIHTKEPIYLTIKEIRKWLISANILLDKLEGQSMTGGSPKAAAIEDSKQMRLFTEERKK